MIIWKATLKVHLCGQSAGGRTHLFSAIIIHFTLFLLFH